MKEYTGQLMGGPDDGNFVTASTEKVTVVSTIELWLDGEDEDKTVDIVVTKGFYIWDSKAGYFGWQLGTSQVFTKKMEAA